MYKISRERRTLIKNKNWNVSQVEEVEDEEEKQKRIEERMISPSRRKIETRSSVDDDSV